MTELRVSWLEDVGRFRRLARENRGALAGEDLERLLQIAETLLEQLAGALDLTEPEPPDGGSFVGLWDAAFAAALTAEIRSLPPAIVRVLSGLEGSRAELGDRAAEVADLVVKIEQERALRKVDR